MTVQTASHPAPHGHRVNFWALMFGCCSAPIFWLGQEMLAYGVSAVACYPGDHPAAAQSTAWLRELMIAFDAVAIIAALAGGIVSYRCWRIVRGEKEGDQGHAIDAGEGRARFMSLWGMLSSLWFFGAILFLTIASVGAPLCTP